MSMLRTLVRDRRVLLLALLALLAIVVGRVTVPSDQAVTCVVKGGYWVLLFIAGYFAYVVGRIVRDLWREWRPLRADLGILCLILVTGGVLLAHERYGYKILADELLLSGTSMGMHYNRDAAYPVRATTVQGPFQILQSVVDKRPIFFPFLVSLVHDFTGYRPENAFYVNTVLGFVFLGLVYLIGWKIGRSRWAGALLVLLFAGLPLLSQQMKGGGFELLNLVMLSAVLLLAFAYAEKRDAVTQEALCYAAVLLAYTRYESILMLVPVAALVLWGWWREQRVTLTWPVVVAPLFLILPLLHNRVFSLNASAWELASRGATVPFGLQYVRENLGHAAAFFFDTTGYQPNSPLFAVLGVIATVFFLLWIVRIVRAPFASNPADVATAFIGIGLVGIFVLLMLYFWGQFDHPVIHRLSLPVHLLMAVAIVAAGASLWRPRMNATANAHDGNPGPAGEPSSPCISDAARKARRLWQSGCVAAIAALVIYSLPAMSRRAYAITYSPSVEMEWRTDFLRRFPARDYLFIDNDSVFWITHHVAATPNTLVKEHEDGLIYHLRNDTFSSMYVMQHFRVDPKTGHRTMEPTDDLGPDFELEPFWEKRIEALFIGRISRIVAIHKNGQVAARAGPIVTPPGTKPSLPRSTEEWDKAKKEYVDKWLKDLP